MPDSDFMLTDEERRQKQSKRRRIIVVVAMLLILLLGAVFGGRPTLNAIKAWQARRHAVKALAYISDQNWLEARKEAMAAYQLRPTEPQSIRAVAKFLSRTRQPDALEFWRQLRDHTKLTREDLEDEAAIAIALGENGRAESAIRELRDSNQMEPAAWLLAAQLSIQRGLADEALGDLRKVLEDAAATEPQQLQAALLELSLAGDSAGTDERVTDAWSRIEKIARGQTAIARDALVLLAQRSIAPAPDGTRPIAMTTDEIRAALENHPLSKAPHKLLALDLQERIDPSRREELIEKGIAQFKSGDAADLLALATWLNGKAQFEKTIQAIPIDRASESRELFLQYLDALGGLGRWQELKQLLENDRYPLDPVVQKMYLARCNAQLGEKTAAENNWQRALEAATSSGDAGKLINLGEYAEKNGVLEVAKSAFDNAVQQAPKLRPAQQGRLRMAQRTGDTKKIHEVLADMLKIWPNDAAIQNDEGYLRLLLMPPSRGENGKQKSEDTGQRTGSAQQVTNHGDLDELVERAAKLVVKNPRSLPHRTFLALAYLKENRPADAIVVYKDVTVARNALTPSALAIHAAVLAANGQAEEAQTEARQVKLDQLLPEERALLDGLPND